jgi:hypothetical protein
LPFFPSFFSTNLIVFLDVFKLFLQVSISGHQLRDVSLVLACHGYLKDGGYDLTLNAISFV